VFDFAARAGKVSYNAIRLLFFRVRQTKPRSRRFWKPSTIEITLSSVAPFGLRTRRSSHFYCTLSLPASSFVSRFSTEPAFLRATVAFGLKQKWYFFVSFLFTPLGKD